MDGLKPVTNLHVRTVSLELIAKKPREASIIEILWWIVIKMNYLKVIAQLILLRVLKQRLCFVSYNRALLTVFIDFFEAFEIGDHKIHVKNWTLTSLEELVWNGYVLQRSSSFDIKSSVPQGSELGSLLFVVFGADSFLVDL